MLRWHRLCAILALPVMAYVIITGAGTEFADMAALLRHAPETSPEMRTMRAHVYGAPSYVVVSAGDYDAQPLPADLDYAGALQEAAALGRAAAPGAALRLVELREYQGHVAGHVQMDDKQLIFDLASKRPLPVSALPLPQPGPEVHSLRQRFKDLHRPAILGFGGAAINGIAGIAISILLATGLAQYWKLYRARARMQRKAPVWTGRDWVRTLHRALAFITALPIIWLVASGLALSADNVYPAVIMAINGPEAFPTGKDPFMGDFSSPLSDAQIAPMAKTTLAAHKRLHPGIGIKVLRLRTFAGYPQGAVIAADADTSQFVYDTRTSAPLSMNEPGYPKLIYPAGWEWHQMLKRIHRGDFFGMPGRWLASIAALALIYQLISGSVMYYQLWKRRAKGGKQAVIWT